MSWETILLTILGIERIVDKTTKFLSAESKARRAERRDQKRFEKAKQRAEYLRQVEAVEAKAEQLEGRLKANVERLRDSPIGELERKRDAARKPKT